MRSVVVVGICGASGSGKSTLAKQLADAFDSPILPISADRYFKNRKPTCCYGTGRACPEMPESVDQSALARELQSLVELLTTVDSMPSVSLKDCLDRSDRVGHRLGDKQVVLMVEGFVLLAELTLVELCDHLVWLECDEETGCQRRFKRRMLNKHTKDAAAEFAQFQSFYGHVWRHHVDLKPVFQEAMVGRSAIRLDSRTAPEEVYHQAFRELQTAIETTACGMSVELHQQDEQLRWERASQLASEREVLEALSTTQPSSRTEVQVECRRLLQALQESCIQEAFGEERDPSQDLQQACKNAVTAYAKAHGWTKLRDPSPEV